jgi:uncharacterized membrane protein YeaQ/YmgE (transglycosylase-associated protein family)
MEFCECDFAAMCFMAVSDEGFLRAVEQESGTGDSLGKYSHERIGALGSMTTYARLQHGAKFVPRISTRKITMSGETFLIILLVGLVAGWLSTQVVEGGGFGLGADLLMGIAGASVASMVLPQLGVSFGSGILAAIASATIGAVILLILVRVIKRA